MISVTELASDSIEILGLGLSLASKCSCIQLEYTSSKCWVLFADLLS